jgi:hypothetical protein
VGQISGQSKRCDHRREDQQEKQGAAALFDTQNRPLGAVAAGRGRDRAAGLFPGASLPQIMIISLH